MRTIQKSHALLSLVLAIMLFMGCYRPYNYEYDPPRQEKYGAYRAPVPDRADNISQYDRMASYVARMYDVDYHLLLALIKVESNGNTDAISSANCRGLTQLSIATARDYDPFVSYQDLHDPEINLDIAGQHLAFLKRLVRNNFPDANLEERVFLNAAAWNAGWGNVTKARGVPRIRETQNMTARVWQFYQEYRWGASDYSER